MLGYLKWHQIAILQKVCYLKHLYAVLVSVECQTEVTWSAVEERISLLEAALHQRPKFSVSTILEGNDKLTRFYTGMPPYDSFVAFVKYLEPKALHLQPWRGSETVRLDDEMISAEELSSRMKFVCFSCMSVANQLFAVLIKLQRGLESLDVSIRLRSVRLHTVEC